VRRVKVRPGEGVIALATLRTFLRIQGLGIYEHPNTQWSRHVRPERRAAAAGYVFMSNDTKLEAKLHFFIGLDFLLSLAVAIHHYLSRVILLFE
jgi:hypothetical protein